MGGNSGQSRELVNDKHAAYIHKFAEATNTFEFYATEHFRLSGVYWGLTALQLLGQQDKLDKQELIAWVMCCQKQNGGFGGSPRHNAHLLHTLSAIQVLAVYDQLDLVDPVLVAACEAADAASSGSAAHWPKLTSLGADVAGLQQPDGSFFGDASAEVDTRFSYCALNCCSLLGQLHALDVPAAARYVAACRNFDGGFGQTPGCESHAGQVFVCVAALELAGSLHLVDGDLLSWWIVERQTDGGGLNGRPEKLPDVCYTWWCLSALSILGRLYWLDSKALQGFILSCQDPEEGGISDRPEDEVDVFHTFFGLAGLSLMGFPGLSPIDPVYALPTEVVQRVKLKHQAAS